MAKRCLSLGFVILVFPFLLINLSTDGIGENQETIYYNALSNTVRIQHISSYTTQYGTTGTDQVMGSGVFIEGGFVLTCYHIFDGYEAGQVKIFRYQANSTEVRQGNEITFIAFDKKKDLLLLQVTPPFKEPAVKVATAVPLTGDDTIITGYASLAVTRLRLYRYLEGPLGIMVTPVFFGDSGGGVFNNNGELIGIIQSVLVIQNPATQNTLYGYATNLGKIKEFLNDKPRQN